MGGRLLDWLGAGDAADRPAAVDMPARIVPGSTALFFAEDTSVLSFFDPSGPAWFEVDLGFLAGIQFQTLPDVDWSTPPTDGQLFKWDNASGKLVPFTLTQYTDEMAQDAIATLIAAGTQIGLSIVYDDALNTLSFTVPPAYSDEQAMDAIAAMIAAGAHTGITITYDDALNKLSFTNTVTQYTDEMAMDAIAAAIAAGVNAGIDVVYDDAGNAYSFRNSRFMIPFWFELPPVSSEVLARYIATDAFTIPANFGTSTGVVASPPGGDFVITVARQVNAAGAFATIGTITIHADSSITFATSGGTSKAIAANDVLRFTAQVATDGAIQGAAFNIRGQ